MKLYVIKYKLKIIKFNNTFIFTFSSAFNRIILYCHYGNETNRIEKTKNNKKLHTYNAPTPQNINYNAIS